MVPVLKAAVILVDVPRGMLQGLSVKQELVECPLLIVQQAVQQMQFVPVDLRGTQVEEVSII